MIFGDNKAECFCWDYSYSPNMSIEVWTFLGQLWDEIIVNFLFFTDFQHSIVKTCCLKVFRFSPGQKAMLNEEAQLNFAGSRLL